MTDDSTAAGERTRAPAWYWVLATGALLFECLLCYAYVEEVRLTPEQIATMPLDLAQMQLARPSWYYAAYGVGVWVGLVGAGGLLLRKHWAGRMLLASLAAFVVQYSAILIVPEMRLVSSDALLGPVIVILIAYGIWQLARLAKQRGWLN